MIHMTTPINSQNKQEYAYELIKSRIMDGTYGAGYRLVIDRLAREFGFSPIPVREAVRRLEAEGLVESERFSGVRVTKIDDRDYVETLSVIAVLEGYATALAYKNLGSEDFVRLREINRQMKTAREQFDLSTYSKLNQDFHRMICDASHHSYLIHQLRSAQERMDAIRSTVFMLIPHRTTDSIAEHEELIRLMESRAEESVVEQCARAHKMATLQAFKRWKSNR
jgi:DNA-binding GntR family transcriptional regulator